MKTLKLPKLDWFLTGNSAATLILTLIATLGLFFLVLSLLWSVCNRFGIAP